MNRKRFLFITLSIISIVLNACLSATPLPTVAPLSALPTVRPTTTPTATAALTSTAEPTATATVVVPTATATETATATLPPTPTSTPTPSASVSGVPFVRLSVSAKAKGIYAAGLKLGNNPKAFSKFGDCMSTSPFFMVPFDNPKQYQLPADLTFLQGTIDNFGGSFSRTSVAARDGFSAASLFNPRWSDPEQCKSTEDPMSCELRLHRPSIVIISLGTNGVWLTAQDFEDYMRLLLERLAKRGVLPILSTKADNVEGDGRFNAVMIKLAKEYELPLWDYYTIAQVLPKNGITDGQYHMEWAPPIFNEGLKTGWQLRNVSALMALDAAWKGVK